MPNLIKLLEHLSFRNPAPKTEIYRLIEKHGLALEAVDCSYCPKTVGLRIKGERTLCSLWRTNANRSVRKVKKAIKKFLREYDRQHGQVQFRPCMRCKNSRRLFGNDPKLAVAREILGINK